VHVFRCFATPTHFAASCFILFFTFHIIVTHEFVACPLDLGALCMPRKPDAGVSVKWVVVWGLHNVSDRNWTCRAVSMIASTVMDFHICVLVAAVSTMMLPFFCDKIRHIHNKHQETEGHKNTETHTLSLMDAAATEPSSDASTHEPTGAFGSHSQDAKLQDDNPPFAVADVHRSVSSAYVPRPVDDALSDAAQPRRSVSSVLRYKKKYAVRNSILANIFFPHEYSHRVASVDEAKASRIRRTTSLLQQQQQQGAGGEAKPPSNVSGDNDDDLGNDDDDADDVHVTADTILERAARAIQSKQAQWFFTALLVLDVFLIIAELVIESNKYCVLEPLHDVHHVSPTYHTSNSFCNTTEITYLGQSTANHRVRFFESSQADCPFEAIPELSHGLHVAENILAWIGKGIIFVFAAELLVLMAALRMHFFRNHMYLIDFVIVSVSIVVEWTVSKNEPSAQLVILVRCWRFARILHGIGISVHEMEEIEVEHLVDDDGNIVKEGEEEEKANGTSEEPLNGDDIKRRGSVASSHVSNAAASSVGGGSSGAATLRGERSFVLENGKEAQPPFRRQKVKYHVIRTGKPRLA
jgi:hypothetical protein